jgi:hypothetical protein
VLKVSKEHCQEKKEINSFKKFDFVFLNKMNNQPVTLVMEGFFKEGFSGRIRRYSKDFKPFPGIGHGRYGLYIPSPPGLVIVSQLKGVEVIPPYETNVLAAFTSYSGDRNLEMLAEFQEIVGIKLDQDTTNKRALGRLLPFLFEGIVKKGPEIMDELAELV